MSAPNPHGRAEWPRRHGVNQLDDRIMIERAGWRTTLDYRENHRRDSDGALVDVDGHWRGEAERVGPEGDALVFVVVGPSPTSVWRRLRSEATAWREQQTRSEREER